MPSKIRASRSKRRKYYEANIDAQKTRSQNSYHGNRDQKIKSSQLKRQSDPTTRKKNAAQVKLRLQQDINYRNCNRTNTKERLQNNLNYKEQNRYRAGLNKKRRLSENAECRKQHCQQGCQHASTTSVSTLLMRRRLETDDECRRKHSQQAAANKRRRLETDDECRRKHSQQAAANMRRRLETDDECRRKHSQQAAANKRRRLETDDECRRKHSQQAAANKRSRLLADENCRTKHRKQCIAYTRRRLELDAIFKMKHDSNTNKNKLLNCKNKDVRDSRRKYWIRRSRLLAEAARTKNLQVTMEKMHLKSSISRLDIRLLFNRAEACRRQGLAKVRKLHDSIAQKCQTCLQVLPSESQPTIGELTAAFDGIRYHCTSSEPYYWELAYKLIGEYQAIPIDQNGVAHLFQAVTNHLPDEADTTRTSSASNRWECNDELCNFSEDLIEGTIMFLRRLAETQSTNAIECYLHVDDCKHSNITSRMGHHVHCSTAACCYSLLRPARTMSTHFPRLRSLVRRVYEVRRICEHIHSVNCAMCDGDYVRLKDGVMALSNLIKQMTNMASSAKEDNDEPEWQEHFVKVDEQSIMESFGKQLRQVTDIRDKYVTQACDICDQMRNDLASLESYVNRSRFNSEKMEEIIVLLYQHRTKHEDADQFMSTTFICRYCADKLKGNKDIARSAFNCLSVVPTPPCLAELNLYERTLIKFAMTCMTVVRLGNVSNKSRPKSELTAALKGRIAHLPVDVAANAQFVPENLFNVDSLIMLVGGQPTKCNKIWVSSVDLNKVHSALAWLRENNWLYKNVPVYSVAEIREKIANKLSGAQGRTSEDAGLLKKLSEAAKCHLYETFTIQPLSGDYPADNLIDYQLGKINSQNLNVFDSDLDVAAFPELFPTGVHGMKDATRKVKIATSDYIKSRLLNKDPKFRLNTSYLFHCFQVQEVSNMCQSVGHMLRSVSGGAMSAKSFYDRLKNKDGEIQSNMFSMMANLRGSKEYFAKLGMEIRWMIKALGPPTIFLTCSTAEWFSVPFLNYLRSVNNQVDGIDKMTPAELCAMDPVNVSIHFNKKWNAIFSKLIKAKDNPIFGEVVDHFWRIEYQARGAPHVHCVLWIKDAPILGVNSTDEVKQYINKIVTCQLPDSIASPTLHDLVHRFQEHKCNKYCMKTYTKSGKFFKKCRFGFPRSANAELKINDVIECLAISKNKQPRKRLYHLPRKNSETTINDYNPALLLANQANIDVQYIGHLGSRLPYYITEYLTKHERSEQDKLWQDIFTSTKSLGSNAMAFLLKSVQSRQVGANEAADRLLGHKLYSKSRQMRFADLRLPENTKRVLKTVAEIERLVKCDPGTEDIFLPHWVVDIYPDRPDSLENCSLHEMLAWYEREKVTSTHRHENQLKHFGFYLRRRQTKPYIVTHQIINPNQSDEAKETYFYYLLKLFKPWRCESDICQSGKSFHETYLALAEQLPKMVDYHESTAHHEKQQQETEDAVRERAKQLQAAQSDACIDDNEGAMQGCINDHIQNAMSDVLEAYKITHGQLQGHNDDLFNMYVNLNSDQKRIVDRLVSGICERNEQVLLVVSGPGGTGKSRVIHVMSRMICGKLKSDLPPVIVSAPTGLAAFNIGGSTIHRILCLPVEHGKPADYSRLNQEQLMTIRSTLKNLKLLIVDEVSMVSSLTLLYMHLRLTEIMCCDDVFGGISVVFFADFLQLPPVKGNQPFIPVTFLEAKQRLGAVASLNLWLSFTYEELIINMRQKGDCDYADLLSRIRIGKITDSDLTLLKSRMIAPGRRATINEICLLYQNLVSDNQSPLILMPRTSSCDEINQSMLTMIGSEIHTVLAIDTQDTIVEKQMVAKVTKAYKQMEDDVTRTAGLERKLSLCIGARVMLKRNKDVEAGLVNGSVGDIVGFEMKGDSKEIMFIKVQFPNIQDPVNIQREAYSFEVLKSIYFTRKQFPLMLAFAITIHKSQGLSLQSAIIDAGPTTFGCGMTYVALSRVTSLQGVHLIEFDKSKIKCDAKAIKEYNRLRTLYMPHLGNITDEELPSVMHVKQNEPKRKRNTEIPILEKKLPRIRKVSECNKASSSTMANVGFSNDISEENASASTNVFEFCNVASISDEFRTSTIDRLNLPNGPQDRTSSSSGSAVSKQLERIIYRQTNFNVRVTVHKILGDGNCLFRAISLAFTLSQNHHELVRAYIVNHMTDSEFHDEMHNIFNARNDSDCSYEEHVVEMQNTGVWGTEHEIITAAHLFQCSIMCFSYFGRKLAIQHFSHHFPSECTNACRHECIYLINKSDHYDLATVIIDYVEE
jgi:ATP-dependent DNA helicase PIF1